MATEHNFKVKKGLDVLGGDVNLGDGFAYKIDGTTVVDSSRNLSNIGTISSGVITATGEGHTFYSSSNSIKFGRNANENIQIIVTDGTNKIVATQDSDGDSGHDFILDRVYNASTGSSNFYIRNAGSNQLSIDKNANVTIAGNLTVQGTTTTIDTANLNVEDNNITLNYSTGDSSSTANGAGITIQDAVNSTTDATIEWSQAGGNFNVSHGWNSLGYLQHSGVLYSRNNLLVLNSAGNGWNTWATRSNGQFNLSVGTITSGALSATGNSTITGSGSTSTALNVYRGSDGASAFRVLNTGEVMISSNYLYVNASQGAYFTGAIRARGGISNDGGNNLSISSGGSDITFNSKNFTSVGTIASGAITSTGNIEGASLETNHTITFGYNSHYLQAGTGSVFFKNSSNASLGGIDASGFNTPYNYQIAGTTVIDSSRNLTNIGTISSGEITATGRSTFDSITIDDDGSGSPLLRVVGDDHSPWLFQLENDSATNDGLFQAYITNDNNLYFRAKETGAYPTWYFQISNGSNHVTSMYLNSSGINGAGHVDVASYKVSTTTVIDSSRNLTNIGRITATDNTYQGGIFLSPASGSSYITANRATDTTGQVGFGYYSGGSMKWVNYLDNSNPATNTMYWYAAPTSSNVMSLTTGGDLDIGGYFTFSTSNHRWTASSTGAANNILAKIGTTGAAGIAVKDSSNNFKFQLYGDGSYYGFLDGDWAGWDIQKAINGKLYFNGDTTYFLQPEHANSAKFRQFVQIGDSSSYSTNSGSWGARLNVTDDIHAKIEVGQDADGMLSHWYAHTGHTGIKFGTASSHDVEFQRAGSTSLEIEAGGIKAFVPFRRSSHHASGFLEGSYNNVGANGLKTNPIYTIGSSYNPAETSLSNMYGIGYARGDASYLSSFTGAQNWGMYVAADGDARIWLDAQAGQVMSTGGYRVGATEVINSSGQFTGGLNPSSLSIGGTTVIDSSRNLSNINSIHTDRYEDLGGTFLFRKGTTSGTSRHINLHDGTGDPSTVDDTQATGITWGQRTDSNAYYLIYVDKENNGGGNYSKLRLNWHTGIQIGASLSYGGTRFYNDSRRGTGGGSLIFSIGDGDNRTRSYGGLNIDLQGNNLTGGQIRLGTNTHNGSKWHSITGRQYDTSTETEGYSLITGAVAATSNQVTIGGGLDEQNASTVIYFKAASNVSTRNGTEIARVTTDGFDIRNNVLRMTGTAVIDSSRNLTNIGTISSGAITSSGTLNITGSGNGILIDNASGGANIGIGEGARPSNSVGHTASDKEGIFWHSDNSNDYGIFRTAGAWSSPSYQKLQLRWVTGIELDGGSATYTNYGVNLINSSPLRMGGTIVIDASRNLTNIGTISSGRLSPSGIQMSVDTGLYATNATLSYYSSTNAVYLNGAGPNGWLRLNAAGSENDTNSINIFGSNAGANITLKTAGTQRMNIDSSGNLRWGSANTAILDASRNLTNIGTISSGATTVNGILTVGGTAAGTEGGELRFTFGSSTTLSGSTVNNDLAGNNVRWFESGGNTRGAYIDISTCENNATSKIWHSGNDGTGSGLDADLLDGKDHTNFGATLATYGTTAGASGRVRCTAPFNTNSLHMFKVTVSLYHSYGQHDYVVGGYMYSTTNQWYSPTCIYTGTGNPDIIVGRDSNGKAYISVANGNYTGVRVHSMTRGYYTSVADTYDPWTITIDGGTENSVTPSVSKVWHSTNDGSGSGLDADLLDGQQGSYYAPASHNHSGVYLPISGKAADSELLDGIDSARVIYGSNATGTTNANPTVTSSPYQKSGFYDVYGTSNNAPTNTYYSYINMRHTNTGNNHGHQIAGSFYSPGDLYNRQIDNNSYGAWSKIWNTTNDGSGSGLDADLVDGYQSARDAGTADTVAIRNGSGDIWTRLIRSTFGSTNSAPASTARIAFRNDNGTSDNYIRTMTNTAFVSWMNSQSGLDADTLDGQHGSYYYSSANYPPQTNFENVYNNLSTSTGSGANLDSTFTSAAKSGNFDCWSGSNFPPSTTHVQGVQVRHSTSTHYGWQLASQYNQPGKMYLRNVSNSTFYTWHTMWSSANDGPGSGLDADTVDGIEAASTIHKLSNTGYYRPDTWIDFQSSNGAGLYWAANTGAGWHIHPTSTAIMRMRSGSTTQTFLELNTTGTARGYVYANNSNDVGFLNEAQSWRIRVQSAGSVYMGATQQMRINSSSTTAIVEGSSTYLVFRNTGSGAISFQKSGGTALGEFTNSGNLNVLGNVTAYGSPSDINLKENIETISNAIEKVQKLDGVTFNYKKDGGRSTGLIAQQLQEVLPEVVYTSEGIDGEEHLAVRYGNTVGLLVEAIKELKQEINELKAQLKEK